MPRVFVFVVVAMSVAGGTALAQSAEDKAAADVLFKDARALIAVKHYAEACPKLEASQHLDPAPGTELNLADCYEQTGRFASAWGMFHQAADDARRIGDTDAEQVALERGALLDAKISHLTIQPPNEKIVGLVVTRNGTTIDLVMLGGALPVDAGDQRIECHAPGRKPWSQSVSLRAGESMTVQVPAMQIDATSISGRRVRSGDSDVQITVDEPTEGYAIELATTAGVLRCDGTVTHDQPCRLKAPPGAAVMKLRGTATMEEDLTLKGKPVLVTVDKTSRYLLYGGATTAGVGALALGVGLVACSQSTSTSSATGVTCLAGSTLGGVAIVAGGAMVVMDLLADHHEVTVHGNEDDDAARERRRMPRRTIYTTPTSGGAVFGVAGIF